MLCFLGAPQGLAQGNFMLFKDEEQRVLRGENLTNKFESRNWKVSGKNEAELITSILANTTKGGGNCSKSTGFYRRVDTGRPDFSFKLITPDRQHLKKPHMFVFGVVYFLVG